MKLNINNIIANDIVDLGIKETSNFNDVVFLDDYLENFDEESKDYILKNKHEIFDCINDNEKIADVYIDEKENSIDMVFYIDYVLDRVERIIYNNAELLDKDIEISEVREIADNILDDDEFNDDITRRLNSMEGNYEL